MFASSISHYLAFPLTANQLTPAMDDSTSTTTEQQLIASLVSRLTAVPIDLQCALPALESLRSLLLKATTSPNPPPKTLAQIRAQMPALLAFFEQLPPNEQASASIRPALAQILSVLCMCCCGGQEQTLGLGQGLGERPVLRFCLQGPSPAGAAVAEWGHEYARHLAMEIADDPCPSAPVIELALQGLIPFFLGHASESDACDLLMELDRLPEIVPLVTPANQGRITLYLASCVPYEPFPYNCNILNVMFSIFLQQGLVAQAAYTAIKIGDPSLLIKVLQGCKDEAERLQVALIASRFPAMAGVLGEDQESLVAKALNGNLQFPLLESFVRSQFGINPSATPADPPKAPEDIYKSWLDTRNTDASDSPRVATANAIVNGILNMGVCYDKYFYPDPSTPENARATDAWIWTPKGEGVLCAVASIGAIWRGSVDEGLGRIDRFLDSSDAQVKAGALMAVGLLTGGSCLRYESDPALAILAEHVLDSSHQSTQEASILSLGIAYAGSKKDQVKELLLPLVTDTSLPISTVAFACLSLALVLLGGDDKGELVSNTLQILMERESEFSNSLFFRFMALALGLLHWGGQEGAEAAMEAVRVLTAPGMAGACSTLLGACAFAGSGNVLYIQQLLHEGSNLCKAPPTGEDEESLTPCQEQALAFSTLGIALVASGEEIGSSMCQRLLNHLMFYGTPAIKRSIPLTLALLSPSNPQVPVIDVLSKWSHDGDKQTAISAVLALGIVGAGTNNSRIANLLRGLANFYYKDATLLGFVKLSQGILHASRGMMTLAGGGNAIGTASLLTLVVALMGEGAEGLVLGGKYPHLMWLLVSSFCSRALITVDSKGEPLRVLVRVGQAVDTVGLAGAPKRISGFHTLMTPVLLGHGERAELVAVEEYKVLSPLLEGVVVLERRESASA